MKKISLEKIIAIIVFLVIIALPMIIWHGMALYKTMDFDLGEKRNKATLSEVFNIETFTNEYEKYFNDRIPFRSILITMKSDIDSVIEEPYKNFENMLLKMMSDGTEVDVEDNNIDELIKYYINNGANIFSDHRLKKDEIDPYVTGINYPIKYLSPKVIIGQSNWTFLNLGNINYYRGVNKPSERDLRNYKKSYERLQKICEKYNKTIVFIVCPEKEEIYPEYMPSMEIINEIERPMIIRDYLATASNIVYVYPKEELLMKKRNYRLYKKYDSHWNDSGAFIATKALKEALGIKDISLTDCDIQKVPERNRDLLFLAGVNGEAYPESFEYDIKYKPEINLNIVYMDNETAPNIEEFVSDSPNKKHLLIMGDSYRISMVTFLSKDFERVTTVVFNCMNNNEVVNNAIKNCDIIVLQAVERNEALTIPRMSQKIIEVLTK